MGFPISTDIFGQLKWLVKQVKLLQFKIASAEQFITLNTAYPTTSGSVALQKLFNSSTNGALTVAGNTTYFFEGLINLSALGTASNNTISFGFLGTATISSILYFSTASKSALSPTLAYNTIGTVATITAVTNSTNIATGYIFVKGKLVIGTGGTIIPSFAISLAAAAVVGAGSYFRLTPIGSNTVASVGNWS